MLVSTFCYNHDKVFCTYLKEIIPPPARVFLFSSLQGFECITSLLSEEAVKKISVEQYRDKPKIGFLWVAEILNMEVVEGLYRIPFIASVETYGWLPRSLLLG